MLVVTALQAHAIQALQLHVAGLKEAVGRQERKLDELQAEGRSGVREVDLLIVKLRRELRRQEKKLASKLKRHTVSPALANAAKTAKALNDRAAAQRRFWTYDRKDMY